MPLGKCYLGKLAISFYLVAGAKKEKKKGEKERRLLVFL
jgi:hypothetical protein